MRAEIAEIGNQTASANSRGSNHTRFPSRTRSGACRNLELQSSFVGLANELRVRVDQFPDGRDLEPPGWICDCYCTEVHADDVVVYIPARNFLPNSSDDLAVHTCAAEQLQHTKCDDIAE